MSTDTDDWLPLIAIACHSAGDWLLQTDRMATEKFDSRSIRAAHVLVYGLTFLPVVHRANWGRDRSMAFLGLLMASHFVIDSRRWVDSPEEFPTRGIWFDQALHVICLALCVTTVDR